MLRRRKRAVSGRDLRRPFEAVLHDVERAKAALVGAVPQGRAPGTPLADAVLGFEEALRDAAAAMPGWRGQGLDEMWSRCEEALRLALGRAEWLRLEAPPLDYEALVMTLGRLLEPLEVFEEADRALGV